LDDPCRQPKDKGANIRASAAVIVGRFPPFVIFPVCADGGDIERGHGCERTCAFTVRLRCASAFVLEKREEAVGFTRQVPTATAGSLVWLPPRVHHFPDVRLQCSSNWNAAAAAKDNNSVDK